MKRKTSLKRKIWISLIIFSISILMFLWLFQVIFLNKYYEHVKLNDVKKIASQIEKNYHSDDFTDLMDHITFDKGVCIEIVSGGDQTYSSNSYSRGCLESTHSTISYPYKREFMLSGTSSQNYKIVNERFHNKTLVHAMRLDTDFYVFINVSLEPLGWATNILASQLVYVTIIVLLLSFVIAYFISRKISNPIVKINHSATKMAKGEFDVVFDTGTDISELCELATTLNQTSQELSKTEELRRDLMANVSHDLKTPLTMIKAYAEMIRDLSYTDQKKMECHLNTIIEETDRLNLLVNDILELSKEQSHVEELDLESFSLHHMIRDILNNFSYLKERDGFQFIYKNRKSCMVYADQKRIEQVLYNLISNAIEHVGEDKAVVIRVQEQETEYYIEIEDHGEGIEEEKLKLIWDRYYKIDKNHKRSTTSTGIGLSIVKSILIRHNSQYGVRSKPKEGTTFYFTIQKGK